MTKRRREQLERKIKKLVEKWVPTLGLAYWHGTIEYTETKTLASSIVQPRYRSIEFYFNLDRIDNECKTREDLEELVIHEIMHAYTWRIWEFADQLTQQAGEVPAHWQWVTEELHEECVTDITNAIMRILREYRGS